jgi:ABC-2 type transport system ATP-binding protein
MMRPVIRISELRVDYDSTCAVRDLSLEVKPGEVYGLIGPNGAGKTTTMKVLLGLIEPTYGKVEVAGHDLQLHLEKAVRATGFMPDFPPLYDDLYVWEFLDLFGASYFIPEPKRREQIEKRLDQVGLTEKRNASITELSRGMRQRLMLAKTLLPEPEVVILDEPASGLDPFGRASLKTILKEYAASGKTVLISSHVLAEMSEMCTSFGIMERGRLVVSGPTDLVASQVLGHRGLVIEVVSGVEKAEAMARGHAQIKSVHREGSYVDLTFSGTKEEASKFLSELIASGVGVCGFSWRKEDLESVFLKVGAKELQ